MIEEFAKYIENKNEALIIFDIGSRDCAQSIEFYKQFPNSKIYAFECNPNTLGICKKNIEPYGNRITLIEGAVCDYDGNIKFFPINQEKTITSWTDGNPGASSLFKSSGKYEIETYVQDEIATPCHRLDSIMDKYGISNVDILWMDLQGAELLALKGLGNYLQNVKYIHTEACNIEIYTNQSLFPEIHSYLSNFFCFDLLNNVDTNNFFGDAIYKNRFLDDPIFPEINLTADEQAHIRGKPKKYLLHAIELFKNFTNGKTILEIGSSRFKMNHDIKDFIPTCCNDGHSTYFWKYYTNSDIYTVDIDPGCKYIIDSDIRLRGVNSYTMDAFEFVKTFNKPIDLLFLDAWDVVPNSPYDVAHLNIYIQIKDKLSHNCIILIDDTDICYGGKGKLLIPRLVKDGFLMIANKRQAIFIKNNISSDGKKNLIETDIVVNNSLFDIVIPVGPNDKDIIIKQIEYTKKNVIGYRNIYLICYDPSIIIDGCITINENIFPFSIETVSNFHGKLSRNGWYLQQLLKLYAPIVIPGILERCLAIDSDTFFLNPTTFINNNKCLHNYGTEYNIEYFKHMLRVDEDLVKIDADKSGISHHMMFEKIYVNELINKIEKKHNDKFYNVFLKMVTDFTGSGASEYEMYFNYMLKNYSNKIELRQLKWDNVSTLDEYINSTYDYVSYHWYMR